MKIGEWLKKHKKTQSWLAKKMHSDQSHVSEWVNGKVNPGLLTLSKFNQITNGEVSFLDYAPKRGKR